MFGKSVHVAQAKQQFRPRKAHEARKYTTVVDAGPCGPNCIHVKLDTSGVASQHLVWVGGGCQGLPERNELGESELPFGNGFTKHQAL